MQALSYRFHMGRTICYIDITPSYTHVSRQLFIDIWFPYRNIIKITKCALKYSLNMRIMVCTPFVLVSCHA